MPEGKYSNGQDFRFKCFLQTFKWKAETYATLRHCTVHFRFCSRLRKTFSFTLPESNWKFRVFLIFKCQLYNIFQLLVGMFCTVFIYVPCDLPPCIF